MMLPPPSTRPPTNLLPPTPFNLGHAFSGFCRSFEMRILLMVRCGSQNGTFPTPSTGNFCAWQTPTPLPTFCPPFQQTYQPSCELIWFCLWVGLNLQICYVRHQKQLRMLLMSTFSTPLRPSKSTLPQQAHTPWLHPQPPPPPGSIMWMFK